LTDPICQKVKMTIGNTIANVSSTMRRRRA
jgi:hypothetical protein